MKKTLSTFLGTLLFFLLFNSSFAQNDAVVKRIIEVGQTDNRTMQHLDILSNRIGGRLSGSDAYNNAVEWAAAEMRSWGMEVSIEEAGTVPVGFNRGPWFGRLLGDNAMSLHFATPSYTSGTKGAQKGHVLIEPKSQEEFDKMKGLLKGAWILVCGNNNGYPLDISANADKRRDSIITENNKIAAQNREIAMANWSSGKKQDYLPLIEEPGLFYKQLRDAGILGVIQSAKVPIQVMYDRKNMESMSFNNLPSVADIKLDESQYAVIKKMAEERQDFLLEFDIRNHFKPGPVTFHNVIGKIKGTKYPDEYVILGAHLDSYDVATGGVDDGSGVSPIMEAARLIMAANGKPKRSILVCLFAAEEFGLVGSHSFVNQHKDKLSKISNMMNRDYVPFVPTGISIPEAMYEDFVRICEPINGINPEFPFEVTKREPRLRPKVARGSDHGPFAVEGVPTFSFNLGDVKGYNFEYDEVWHTERDLYNKSIPEYQNHTAIVSAIVAYGIANLDHLLSRKGMYLEEKAVQ